MPQIFGKQVTHQLFGIGQIAVMSQRNTVGRIHIQWLSFRRAGRARRRVTALADPHIALQPLHVLALEHILDQTVVLT